MFFRLLTAREKIIVKQDYLEFNDLQVFYVYV